MVYVWLAVAIVAEVVGTTALKATGEFTRLGPSILVVASYCVAFYTLTLVLRTMPIGVAYAIWCGLGIVLVNALGLIVYRQVPDGPAVLGVALIIAGTVIINAFSRTVAH